MIAAALIAALLLAPVAPARGEPGNPYVAVVHVHGWNRLITPLLGVVWNVERVTRRPDGGIAVATPTSGRKRGKR